MADGSKLGDQQEERRVRSMAQESSNDPKNGPHEGTGPLDGILGAALREGGEDSSAARG